MIKNGHKQSNLKKTISTENFHTSPKTVRFREQNGDDSDNDNDIDTAEARRRNPKSGRQFLLGDGKGSWKIGYAVTNLYWLKLTLKK